VKRTFVVVAGLLAVGAAAYLGSRVWGQNQGGGQPSGGPLRTRIALVNMVQVLKNYTKFKQDEEHLKTDIKAVEGQIEPLRNRLIQLKTEINKPGVEAAAREPMEKEGRQIQIKLQDLQEEANKKLGKMQGDMAVKIYHEVEEAVQLFARVNDIELVLMYNDADRNSPNKENEFYSPGNVGRKMTMFGPAMPLVYDPRMDITVAVTQMLNQRLAPAGN